jgi:diacylglycerol kinase family enzyme
MSHRGGRKRPGKARIWAWIALAAAVGVLATLVVLLFDDVVALLLVLAALGLAGAGLWLAATRRGIGRLLGIAVAVVALAGGVVALVTQGLIDELVALVVAIAAFGAASRMALRTWEGLGGTDSTHPAARPARARSAVLLINPKSGGGKAERFDLAGEARKRGIRAVVLERGDDLLELAEQALSDGADVIGMAGGDGSQALVATVAMRHNVPHVCIPAGTRNHFALDLGLDRDDVIGALDAFTDGVERRIDLARVNDHVFVNNASLGVYAEVVQSDAYRDAKLETWTQMLPELLGPGAPPIDLEFEGPDGTELSDAPLVLVSNNPYQLTSLAGAGTRPRLDTGRLGLVAARITAASDIAEFVMFETVGQAQRFHGLLEWSEVRFEVRSSSPVAVGLDGEALMLEPPLQFVSLPGALRVRLPERASNAAAATSASFTRDNLRTLSRIATGHPHG